MTFLLRASDASPSLYEPDDPGGHGWMGFVFAAGAPPGPAWRFFAIEQLWSAGSAPSGFLVFAPRRPTNPAAFATALLASDFGQQDPTIALPTWVPDPDAAAPAVCGIDLAFGTGGPTTTGPGGMLGFGGGFTFAIPPNGAVRFSDDALTIQGVFPGFTLAMANGRSLSGFANWLTVPLRGPARGQLQLTLTTGLDPSVGGADLAQHFYFVDAGTSQLTALRYPVFDVGPTGPKLGFDVVLDPAAPYDPARTRFGFQAGAPALTSGFTTTIGQTVTLTPQPGAALVFQPLPTQLVDGVPTGPGGAGVGSYLAPCGPFQLGLTPPMPDGSVQLLGGLAGAEYVRAPAPPVMTFVANQPALCRSDPTAALSNAPLALDDGGGLAVTAWPQLGPGGSGALAYCSQPQDAPLYGRSGGAPWLFGYAESPLWTGAGPAPLMPMIGYGLVDPSAPFAAYTALEQHVLAPARWLAAVTAAGSGGGGATGPLVTGGGLVVETDASGWTRVVIAETTDAGGATHTFSLDQPGPELVAALQAGEVFVVATRATDGTGRSLFAVGGDVAIADWTFQLDLAAGAILIAKFASASIATLAGVMSGWALPAVFNADPAATQRALTAAIADAVARAGSSDPTLAAMYAGIAAACTDPTWNGVLVLGPQLPGLPPVVEDVASGLPVGVALTGHHVGVRINDVGHDGTGAPLIERSAVFALVDYEAPPPATGAATAADYTFDVGHLRALFTNAQLARFDCEVELGLDTLFGVPAVVQAGLVDAPTNLIVVQGSYQARPSAAGGQQGSYTFVAPAPVQLRLAYEKLTTPVAAPLITTVVLEKIQYAPLSHDGDVIRSRFALWGWLACAPVPVPPSGLPPIDLFDYERLAFSNLGLIMSSHRPSQAGDPTWAFDTEHVSFDLAASVLRPGLANDLPVSIVQLAYDPAGGLTPAGFGCTPLALSSTALQPVPTATFALVYRLDLGGPGAMAALTQNLIATIVVGWQPGGGRFAAIGIPGLGPQSQLPLQGVMPIAVGGYALAQDKNGRVVLQLTNCTASFLGGAVPPGPLAFTLGIVGVAQGASNTVIWFGEAS